jgi:glutamate--cysteine ligase
MLPFVYDEGFGYEAYADYMLNVPMYFVFRDGKYIDAAGLDFRDFLAGKLSVLPGETPRLGDWNDHLSTAFPEVRLKSFLEMRGADGGPWNKICALPAFWVGLLYDDQALDAAWDEIKHWTIEDHNRIRAEVPRLGLAAKGPRGRSFQQLGREILDIAHKGLAARKRLNGVGDDETGFLDPLREIVESGKVPAQRLLDRYNGEWNGDLNRVYDEMSF